MTPQAKGKVDKGWGYEIVWANTEHYSGKLLVFEHQGAKTSLVFHKQRSKSWFVNAGKFKITFIDTQTGEVKSAELAEGQTVDLGELGPHQVEALAPGSIIFEVGTTDYVEDRFRLAPGDTQRLQAKPTPADPS
jgi:mannose-6-phosphate isomerase-like protein (cupin superfamily)